MMAQWYNMMVQWQVDGLDYVDFCCDVWDAFTFQVNFMFDKYL